MTIRLTRDHFLLLFDAWWIFFIALVSSHFNDFYILSVVGFISLLLVPGILTIASLRMGNLNLWTYISFAVGFSLLELMVVGLLGNTLLPPIGVARPLDSGALLSEFSILVGALAAISWVRMGDTVLTVTLGGLWRLRDWAFAFLPILFVFLSVVGALSLNLGGEGSTTLVMLIGMGLYSAALLYWSKQLGENVIPTALFFMALSLLLMTSLRSPYIIGHDIQSEFRVFELAKNAGFWTIASYRDAYNACMSITILPTIFSNLTLITDPYVYKVFFQIIFAVVPAMVYLLIRRYTSTVIAFLSTLYFIAFPTFFTDMPFLNRQEIAFVFLALMFLTLFNEHITLTRRRLLFVLFGVGMILSHYSTTYTVVALLIFLVLMQPILNWLGRFLSKRGLCTNSGLAPFNTKEPRTKSRITVVMVGVLAAGSFFWSSVLTDTSSNSLYRVVAETVAAMQNILKEEARSGDVLYNLFSWKKVDQKALLKEYEKEVAVRVSEAPAGTYYKESAYAQYPITVVAPELMPLTLAGKTLKWAGVDVEKFNYLSRQLSAKALQIFILIGFLAALLSRRWFTRPLDSEFVLMAGGSLLMLAAIIILPVLSVEYGLLRAFQQSLMFLSVFIVIGSMALLAFAEMRKQVFFASALAVLFLLSSTGVFTQFLGGYNAQLHLNNSGQYYDLYYVHESERKAIEWLASEVARNAEQGIEAVIQSDNYALQAAYTLRNAYIVEDIYPALVRKDAYVFLGVANVTKQRAVASYNGTGIVYTYPIQFLLENKTLVYDSADVEIYR